MQCASIRSHWAAAAEFRSSRKPETMGVRSRSKRKRQRRASARGPDLISGLGDDVLLRVIQLLPDARDAVRTGALSRRWRGLWTRASSLTFASSSRKKFKRAASSGDKRFLAVVNQALAQRAMTDAALENLAISFAITSPVDDHPTRRLVLRSADAAHEWVRHAVHYTVKSFVLKLHLLPACHRETRRGNVSEMRQQKPMMNLSELAGWEKLETMHWRLEGVRLQLPTAAVFSSLVDLSLEDIEFAAGSDHLLARFLSSACCPSLQKLQLSKFRLPNLKELLIEASTLIELSMSTGPTMKGSWTLKLETPRLRYFRMEEDYANLRTLEISAPRLEELTFLPHQPDRIELDDELPCVRSLKVVELESHGADDGINNGSICLLRRCTSLACLEVSLHVDMEEYGLTNIISGRIPHLRHLISLTVRAYLPNLHLFGVGLVEILKQCSYLKYLRIHCIQMGRRDGKSLCNHPDHWKSQHMYLTNIQEVDFTGLVGTDCEHWFIRRVLAHATKLQKVALSFHQRCRLHNMIDGSRFIACNGGAWVCHDPLSYEWNCGSI